MPCSFSLSLFVISGRTKFWNRGKVSNYKRPKERGPLWLRMSLAYRVTAALRCCVQTLSYNARTALAFRGSCWKKQSWVIISAATIFWTCQKIAALSDSRVGFTTSCECLTIAYRSLLQTALCKRGAVVVFGFLNFWGCQLPISLQSWRIVCWYVNVWMRLNFNIMTLYSNVN